MNPFEPGYYTEADLQGAGFRALGKDVHISKNCTIIAPENISIGDHVRIDGYCTIVASGGGHLTLGSYIHIGAYCLLSAGAGIRMDDFSGLSHGVKIYSRSDDYSGRHLTNPTVPARYTAITEGEVTLGRHVIVGSGSVILPRVSIGEGSAVGALSLVSTNLDVWGIFFGSPAKRLKSRSRQLLELEAELRSELASGAAGAGH